MNKTAKMLYMNLDMRIRDYQKTADDEHNSLSVRNDANSIATGLIIAKFQLVKEFSLDYTAIDKRIKEIRDSESKSHITRKNIRPPDHSPNCHLVLFNGNGKCSCGDDERWDREYNEN